MRANVITNNYVTKQEMAVAQCQLNVVASNQQIFQAHALQSFATKAELSHAVNQLTWRMAGFTITLIGAIAASARYL